MERTEAKFITHNNGALVRVPPYVVRERVEGTQLGSRLSSLISTNPYVYEPTIERQLPNNLEEVLKLRRLARKAAGGLGIMAQKMGFEEYCVILRGSTARGDVKTGRGGSDLDMNLIVKGEVSEPQRAVIRNWGYSFQGITRVKADVLLFPLRFFLEDKGREARACVRDCALPVKDNGLVFGELKWAAFESLRFLELCRSGMNFKKKLALEALKTISDGDNPEEVFGQMKVWECVSNYLSASGFVDFQNDREKAKKLLGLLEG